MGCTVEGAAPRRRAWGESGQGWFAAVDDPTVESHSGSSLNGDRNPSHDNSFGVEAGAYDLVIDASTGTLPIVTTSDQDGISLAVPALAVAAE